MSLVSRIIVSIKATLSSALDNGSPSFPCSVEQIVNLANGTGANEANALFSDARTLSATTSENLDLSGSLTDAFGATLTFTKIKALIVTAAAANTGDIEVGGAASNGFNSIVGAAGDLIKVKPGGTFVLIAPDASGYAVTAGTGDILKVNNAGAASGTYNITLIGI